MRHGKWTIGKGKAASFLVRLALYLGWKRTVIQTTSGAQGAYIQSDKKHNVGLSSARTQ